MIKKIFGLLIGTFVLLGSFSNAFDPSKVSGIVPIGDQSTFFDGNICSIDTSLSISCSRSSRTITSLDSYHDNWISSIFWSSDGIGVYYSNTQTPEKSCQGLIKSNFFICQGDYNNLLWPDLQSSNCANGFTKVGGLSYQELLGYLKGSTPLYYYNINKAGYYGASIGFIYEDFYFATRVGGYDCGINNGSLTSKNLGFTGNIFSDINFNNPYISTFPGSSTGSTNIDYTFNDNGNTVSLDLNLDNVIRYYESTFGFDENMCYVGTYDTGSVYGTPGINFIKGYGNTIYGLYHGIYGSFGNNKIKNVGSFVNVWLLNYGTWFDTVSDERLFVANYNGPDQNVSYIYTGFTFPFANKPVAIYFMADLLANEYIKEESMGEHIVYYCDLKLNYENYKNGTLNFNDVSDLVDPKIKDRIKYNIDYRLGGDDGYSTPGSGSIWGNLVKSGYQIPQDLNPTNLFKDFYDKINGIVTNFSPARDVGIVPWWILYPMIFLILFRILRH